MVLAASWSPRNAGRAIAFGLEHQKDRAIEDRQMTKQKFFSIAEKLRCPCPTLVAHGEMLRVLNLQRDVSLCQHGVHDADLWQIQ